MPVRYAGPMTGRPLLSRAEMQAADRWTIEELGVPSLVLMETAGRAVADALRRQWSTEHDVVAVCGTGNNGADGLVVARVLASWGYRVRVARVGALEKLSSDAAHQLAPLEKLGVPVTAVEGEGDVDRVAALWGPRSVLVDALFGVGLDRPVAGWRVGVVEALNGSGRPVVAVDLPSGVDANTGAASLAVRATRTVTFQHAKRGLLLHPGRERAGQLEVVDIGIPPRALTEIAPAVRTVDPALRARLDAPRDPDSHKGTYGHVLVVAGTPDRPGSALLAARAALKTGSGLVTLGSTAEVVRRLAPALEELMGAVLGESALDASALREAWLARDVLLVGPSLPGDARLGRVLGSVLAEVDRPAVLDAGALAAVSLDELAERPGPTVLTPHPGEMSRLLGGSTSEVQADRIGAATRAAQRSRAVVVLKGASTVVAHPDGRAVVVESGNPGLASGGTGDVLGGVIASLCGQGFSSFEAAEAGADLHGRAADAAVHETGQRGLVASALLAHLGRRPAPRPGAAAALAGSAGREVEP